ncbi:hypothetical protein [Actinotalea subterranea]|uniref:hypothetical protein n=1 Tax=Actinotalea subterranea TaxID=2607497 RepID=UPI0011F00303|nr:hypothetical protein [Actinotalea subterranea]
MGGDEIEFLMLRDQLRIIRSCVRVALREVGTWETTPPTDVTAADLQALVERLSAVYGSGVDVTSMESLEPALGDAMTVVLSGREVLVLAACLREAVDANDDWEFPILMGAETFEVRALEEELLSAYRSVGQT